MRRALFVVSFLASSMPVVAATGTAAPSATATGHVTRPEEHLGRALAADSMLPDWDQVRGYFEKLAKESPRVKVEAVGKTTEGRDFVLAVISSEANLANLDKLKVYDKLLADPRGATREQRLEALDKGRVMLFVSCAMHATECAAPQFAMQLAYDLSTSEEEPWKSAREQCVVLLLPSTNPDGLDDVAKWYRQTVGTPYEASDLPKLYQRYAGHDNNRDWFALTQKETRVVTELLYGVWRPHVYWDVHQQGSKAERMFVPPFRDPLDPNLDAGIITAINVLGTRAQADMTREGKTGVACGGTFDMWWNGGNRNVPVRHNIVGLLTESASAKLATPIFQQRSELVAPDGLLAYGPSNRFPAPWPGGWWRLRDIVEYESAFARSLIGSLARERRWFLETALQAAENSIRAGLDGSPSGWILPTGGEKSATDAEIRQRDPGAAKRLVDILLATGVEVGVAADAFEADGRAWPKQSIVIRSDQPYGRWVKDLFEVQQYPGGQAPYDVAGWTLPLLLGVECVEVRSPLRAKTRPLVNASELERGFAPDPRTTDVTFEALSSRDSDAWKAVFAGLAQGRSYSFESKSEMAGRFVGYAKTEADRDPTEPILLASMPRIGLYSPWSGNSDEGWMRWVFDTFGVRYVTLRNERMRAGELAKQFDVIVIPSVDSNDLDKGRAVGSIPDELAGGLDPEGSVAVEEFVRGGGTLIAIGSSGKWAVDLLRLPLVEVTSAPEAKEFSCPGSVLRTIPQAGSAFTADLGESLPVFFAKSQAWRDMTDAEKNASGVNREEKPKIDVLLRYASARLLMSGWIAKPEVLANQAAWLRATHGKGALHVFGFHPQYRGWSQAAFQTIFRAILLEKRAR